MTTELCPFGVPAAVNRLRAILAHLAALFIAGFCLVVRALRKATFA